MKRSLALLTTLLVAYATAIAAHITGGEMIYEYLGPGETGNSKKYRITLRLFRDNLCTGCAGMPVNVYIGIFNNDNGSQHGGTYFDVVRSGEHAVPVNQLPQCVNNAPPLSYNVAYFELVVDLPNNSQGYTATYQTCCRVNPLVNVYNSTGGGGTGATYSCTIPGTNTVSATAHNNSPKFAMAIDLICYNKAFNLDFSAQDADGDSLVYSFCDAYDGGFAQGANNINPSPPPYGSAPYINGFTPWEPLGPLAQLDPQTGFISGVAPDAGKYVVCVCVDEYRNGVKIASHRKDFIVNVASCDFAGAQLMPAYSICDSFTAVFENLNNSPENHTFFWDFGVAGSLSDTSNLPVPSFTFPDTGVYLIKLYVNRGEPCNDSTTAVAYVYPGFFPGFTTTGICVSKPTQFTDTTSTRYGVVNSWRWNFGDQSTFADTSRSQNPSYTYTQTGTYNVVFTVTSSKGCFKTIRKDVTIIDKPPLSVYPRDTLICVPDNVQLQATGSGIFSWSPLTNIINPGTATPTVNPTTTTKYYVELDDNGCKNRDSVLVRVVTFVTLNIPQDTITICRGDGVQLGANTDGLRFTWSPSIGLDNVNALNCIATPDVHTRYFLTATIGSCVATDNVLIRVIPYPTANAGPDVKICFNTATQLGGSIIGSSFSWSPANTLNSPFILNPVATPFTSTYYTLSAFDTLGCPKPGRDTVFVEMLPKIQAFAGNDTAVVQGQPLQLHATGGELYLWSPPTGLSAINSSSPIATLNGIDSIRYKVLVSDERCTDSAFVTVKVFKTDPQVFVPTAFTPNGDGLNDLIRPIAVGIKEIEYFRIFNRWGQLVFSTQVNGQGWDGRINGQPQGTNAYVWVVKAVDYLGKPFFKKGTVTLIR